jgi:mono/diheme cytochrome c family protein
VLKQDKSVVPALTEMARTHAEPLARFHALWTLEGLDALTQEIVREKLKDAHPQVRAAAIRVSESFHKAEDQTLVPEVVALMADANADVAIQAILTVKRLDVPDWQAKLGPLANTSPIRGVKEIGSQILNPPVPESSLKNLSEAEQKLFKDGETTYQTLCSACHGIDGKGMPMLGAAPGSMLAPALAGSKTVTGWRDAGIHVLLQGLTGDIDGKRYEGQMIPMATNDDAWIASVLSYVRNSFGNRAGFVTPDEVARLRAASKDRTQPWTIEELRARLPQPLPQREKWKLTASHAPKDVGLAVDGKPETRYATKTEQVPGMWLQIELPQPTRIGGLELESIKSPGDYPRGYTVELSNDGVQWGKPIATGKGNLPDTVITFPPTEAKFIRITQTGEQKGKYWSVHELQIFAAK